MCVCECVLVCVLGGNGKPVSPMALWCCCQKAKGLCAFS